MKSTLMRYATPFITSLFLVSLISGVALFFHIGPSGFHGMHEWLSIVLIVPFVLHLWKNWRPMTAYFKRPAFVVAMGISIVAAAAFMIPVGGEGRGGRPAAFDLSAMVMQGSVAEVASVLHQDSADLTASLESAGYSVNSEDETLSAIAAAAGKSEMDIAATLVATAR